MSVEHALEEALEQARDDLAYAISVQSHARKAAAAALKAVREQADHAIWLLSDDARPKEESAYDERSICLVDRAEAPEGGHMAAMRAAARNLKTKG